MSVSGVGRSTPVVVPAPAPKDRVPSEAARDAATKQTATKDAVAKDVAHTETARQARQEQPREQVAPLKGLSMNEMFVLLGMHPVSPTEAARLAAREVEHRAVNT